jgi:hypothetical protein
MTHEVFRVSNSPYRELHAERVKGGVMVFIVNLPSGVHIDCRITGELRREDVALLREYVDLVARTVADPIAAAEQTEPLASGPMPDAEPPSA